MASFNSLIKEIDRRTGMAKCLDIISRLYYLHDDQVSLIWTDQILLGVIFLPHQYTCTCVGKYLARQHFAADSVSTEFNIPSCPVGTAQNKCDLKVTSFIQCVCLRVVVQSTPRVYTYVLLFDDEWRIASVKSWGGGLWDTKTNPPALNLWRPPWPLSGQPDGKIVIIKLNVTISMVTMYFFQHLVQNHAELKNVELKILRF